MRNTVLFICILLLILIPALIQGETNQRCFSVGLEGGSKDVVITKGGKYIGAGAYDIIHIFLGGLAPAGFYKLRTAYSNHLAAHPTDEKIIAAAWDRIYIIDMAEKNKIAELKPKKPAEFVAWKSGGIELVSIDENFQVQIWNVNTRKTTKTWSLPLEKKATVLFADYSEQAGLLAIATADGTVRVFDAESGEARGSIMAHPREGEVRLTGMDFHPEGKLLATCEYGNIKIWDTTTMGKISQFSTQPGGLASLIRYYANGTKLAVANYVDPVYGFIFLDAASGKIIAQGRGTKGYDSITAWDMAYPDSEDPELVFATDERIYCCRFSSLIR
jgi:WD40 repeat protein